MEMHLQPYFLILEIQKFLERILIQICKYKSERVKNFFLDNSERISLDRNLINKKINFDIIIEDEKCLKDQIFIVRWIFKLLKPRIFIKKLIFLKKN